MDHFYIKHNAGDALTYLHHNLSLFLRIKDDTKMPPWPMLWHSEYCSSYTVVPITNIRQHWDWDMDK